MASRPDVSGAEDIYEAFAYLTPDFNGNLTAADMLTVLEWIGITGRSEQAEVMSIWREMHRQFRPKPPEVPSG